jgi:hypothetical protein
MKPKNGFAERIQTLFYVKVPAGDGILNFGGTRKFFNSTSTLSPREEP